MTNSELTEKLREICVDEWSKSCCLCEYVHGCNGHGSGNGSGCKILLEAAERIEDNGMDNQTLKDYIKEVNSGAQASAEKDKEKQKPMTLDELKQMDRETVWCVDGQGSKRFAVVDCWNEMCEDTFAGDWEFYEYGVRNTDGTLTLDGWLAYRVTPPEVVVDE